MNAKGIQSDLKALQELYGLLLNDGDGVSNLDEHARFLLKSLLDADTQRVLKAYVQMIAARVEAPSSVSPAPTLQVNSIVSEAFNRKFGKEQVSDQKKRCMVCQKSSVEADENLNNYTYFELQQNNQAEPPLENGNLASNLRGCTDFSSEASEVIKEIDSCIASLQLGADYSNLFEPNNIMRPSTSQFTRIRGQALEGNLSRESIEERNLHTREMNADRQKVKRIVEKIESGKWRTNHNNFLPKEIHNQGKRTSEGVPPEDRNYYMKSRKSVQRQELDRTYSSNWSSEQNSSYGSEGEDYSSPGPNSEEYSSLSSEIESQYGTSTSNCEEDVYSSSGSDELTFSNSCRSDGNSSYNHRTIQSRLKAARSQIHKPANERNLKKQGGTWKRLKDRLGVVFHHHHFHRGKSVISKTEAEACGEKAVEKMRKAITGGKKKQNNYHGIMEAVLSHVPRSKQNEVEKIVPLAKGQSGNKKVMKKSKRELWKRVGKKKPGLKALPKIK